MVMTTSCALAWHEVSVRGIQPSDKPLASARLLRRAFRLGLVGLARGSAAPRRSLGGLHLARDVRVDGLRHDTPRAAVDVRLKLLAFDKLGDFSFAVFEHFASSSRRNG